MDNQNEREGYIKVTARFPAAILGSKFPYYCGALGVVGLAVMVAAIVLGVQTK